MKCIHFSATIYVQNDLVISNRQIKDINYGLNDLKSLSLAIVIRVAATADSQEYTD